jgi:branched-chain amino acid transport system ATP-binding protein
VLEVANLSCHFGAVAALSDFSLTVKRGEVIGLIGPNGSGKTSFFNVLTGVYRPSAGTIRFAGKNITGLKPHLIVAMGVARTFQNLRIFGSMSVLENVLAATHVRPAHDGRLRRAAFPRRDAEPWKTVHSLLDHVGLGDRAEVLADDLPLADLRRLELARALARDPQLLLLDEPAGGMTDRDTRDMAGLIRDLAVPGRTCIVIEHKLDMISKLCGSVCVLNFGHRIAFGEPRAVLKEPAVVDAYLGAEEIDA